MVCARPSADGPARDDRAVSPVIGVVLLVSFVALMAVGATLIVRQSAQNQVPVVVDTQILWTETDGEPGADGAVLTVNQLSGVDKLTGVEIRYQGTTWTVPDGLEKGDTVPVPCPGEDPTLTLTIETPRGPGRETVAWWNVPSCAASSTANSPPVAEFTYQCPDLSCDFDAELATDPDGTIQSYAWDFGDGATATGKTVSHTYGSDGDYTVKLTVTDDEGASDAKSKPISVSGSSGDGGGGGECINHNLCRLKTYP